MAELMSQCCSAGMVEGTGWSEHGKVGLCARCHDHAGFSYNCFHCEDEIEFEEEPVWIEVDREEEPWHLMCWTKMAQENHGVHVFQILPDVGGQRDGKG